MSSNNGHFPAKREKKSTPAPVPAKPTDPGTVAPMSGGGPGIPPTKPT